ncbi:MAG: DUF1996 domain-containing protein [Pseudomonadota bacterium]
MIETGVAGDVDLDAYESTIRVVVNTAGDISQLQFGLSGDSGSHCPDIAQNDDTIPYEFTVDTPTDGGACVYVMRGARSGSSGTIEETLSIAYANNGSTGPGGGSGNPVRYDFTFGTNGTSPYKVGELKPRSGHGNRIYCVVSHFSYDDPVVFPGEPELAHLHMFWGNTATDAYTTSQSILTTGAGSCEGGLNYRVGAWIPALFNAQDEVVVPEEVFIYYKTFGGSDMRYDLVQEVPQGLGMLASADTLNFRASAMFTDYVTRNGRRAFLLGVSFPPCVATENGERDGQPILSFRDMPGDAANQVNSHVAYPASGNEVDCPLSHPYRFPTPQFRIFFDADEVGDTPYLSSDAMAGAAPLSTLHGDYMFGADPDVNEEILQCVRESRSCGFDGGRKQLPDRFLGVSGEVYVNSVTMADGVDRTPFGDTLPPFLPQSLATMSSAHRHHHGSRRSLGSALNVVGHDLEADIFTLWNNQWVGDVFDGATVHAALNEALFMELKLPRHVLKEIGSVEISLNGELIAVDNDAPFHSFGDVDAEDRTGLLLNPGVNTLRVRFYEQKNLGGSFLNEQTLSFTVH